MTNTEENKLAEEIATLLDKYLSTTIDDMTHINKLITTEKEVVRLEQAFRGKNWQVVEIDQDTLDHNEQLRNEANKT